MAENITNALLIMAIGMGVVFAAIFILWGVMAALVRLTTEKIPDAPEAQPVPQDQDDQAVLRRRAAAAAVAVARQQASRTIEMQSIPASAGVSPWQAVMRGRQLRQRGPR